MFRSEFKVGNWWDTCLLLEKLVALVQQCIFLLFLNRSCEHVFLHNTPAQYVNLRCHKLIMFVFNKIFSMYY